MADDMYLTCITHSYGMTGPRVGTMKAPRTKWNKGGRGVCGVRSYEALDKLPLFGFPGFLFVICGDRLLGFLFLLEGVAF